jgi:hypothetical protein
VLVPRPRLDLTRFTPYIRNADGPAFGGSHADHAFAAGDFGACARCRIAKARHCEESGSLRVRESTTITAMRGLSAMLRGVLLA